MSNFRILKKSQKNKARKCLLKTRHGIIKTPFFMPIATKGAVKGVSAYILQKIGVQIVLSNTYHLSLRPGLALIKKAGGLHKFMSWQGPILTDSGGYQVFSLAKFRKINCRGVLFKDNISGREHFLTPEKAIQIQIDLGSDIIMALDECPPYPCPKEYAAKSLKLTMTWAKRCLIYFQKHKKRGQRLFGIIQGSVYKDLRQDHAKEMAKLPFDGFAIGGLAVGEPVSKMYEVLKWVIPLLPENKPRYLMGVGYPEQIIKAVNLGIDMFDSVVPTRNARHGSLYFRNRAPLSDKKDFYEVLRIKQAKYKNDLKFLNKDNRNLFGENYSRAYLRHLFMSNDPLAYTLATIHNLQFYMDLMNEMRKKL